MSDQINAVLNSLCEGSITFSEASQLLGLSKDKVEELLESFVWVPSVERISELCEIERETLSLVEYKNRTVFTKISDNSAYSYNATGLFEPTANFSISVRGPMFIPSVPCNQETVVFNKTGFDGVPYIQ